MSWEYWPHALYAAVAQALACWWLFGDRRTTRAMGLHAWGGWTVADLPGWAPGAAYSWSRVCRECGGTQRQAGYTSLIGESYSTRIMTEPRWCGGEGYGLQGQGGAAG